MSNTIHNSCINKYFENATRSVHMSKRYGSKEVISGDMDSILSGREASLRPITTGPSCAQVDDLCPFLLESR